MDPRTWWAFGPGEDFGHWAGPMWVLAILIVTVGILLIVGSFLLARWVAYKNRSKTRLRKVWKQFLRNIPGEFRRYIMLYQPFVVFGESGSGKSSLIGRYTDWKGQAAQFYPSYNADPQLQIYLGSRALVEEVPSTLLVDTSSNVRIALVRLWGPVFKKREPIAVVTVSAAALRKATPESLRTQAQVLRGKINILSRISNKPIQTRIVVTHMDQVEGYLAYSQFVEKNDVPHQLQLDPKAPDGNLAHCLEPQEKYLPLALTTLSAKNYLKVLTFLNKAPETFENLGALLRALKEPDPLSFEPKIEDLFLTSDQGGSPSAVSNPFAASWTDHHVAVEKAMVKRHGRITLAIALLGLAYLGTAFFWERHQLSEARVAVADFEEKKTREHARDAVDKIHAVEGAESSWVRWFLPNFYRGTSADLRRRYVEKIRATYLLPRFGDLERKNLSNAPEYALLLTGVICASNNDSLGSFILPPPDPLDPQNDLREQRLQEIAAALTIEDKVMTPAIIRSYVELSDEPFATKFEFVPRDLPYQPAAGDLVNTTGPYSSFLEKVTEQTVNPRGINASSLSDLKSKAQKLKNDFDNLRRRRTGQSIYKILEANPSFPSERFQAYVSQTAMQGWLASQSRYIDDLLALVLDDQRSSLTVQEVSGTAAPLENLNYGIEAIRQKQILEGRTITIVLDGKTRTVRTADWDAAINKGRMQTAVTLFTKRNQDARSRMFFPISEDKPDEALLMKPRTASDYAFKGRGGVSARYTKDGYETYVQHHLMNFEKTFGVASVTTRNSIALVDTSSVHLDEGLKKTLHELIQSAAEEYANDYYEEWRKFYTDWQLEANDTNTLRAILVQMASPTSRYQEFLNTILENTNFDASPSRKQNAIFERLADFRRLNKLQDTGRGQNPEIDKYRTILAGVAAHLDGKPADKSKDAVQAADMRRAPIEFSDLLSPVGRLSYAILHESRDSKRITVEEWLKANGIEGEWARPFLEPIDKLHKLGVEDIEQLIQKNWERRVLSQAIPILEKFPFNKNAVSDATPHLCEETLLPSTGLFWTAWRNLIAPVCVEDQNGWKPMRGLEKLSESPKGMFEVVSALARITKTLWEKDSVPKLLKFEIQPQPLPVTRVGKPAIVLSFIHAGKSSVFGFNQKLYWQTLSIDWWNRPPASVGLQVGDPGSNTKSNRSINEPESAWSFYRLLLRDRHAEQKIWVWDLTQGEPEYPAPLLKFQFRDDPWAIFYVPGFDKPDNKEVSK